MKQGQGAHLSGQRIGHHPTAQMNPGDGDGNGRHQVASGHASADPELMNLRIRMTNRIWELLSREPKLQTRPRKLVSDLAKRFEAVIYKKNPNKQGQQMLQQLTSSSSYGTTIPIPDVVQNASGNTRALYEMDNTSGPMSNGHHHFSANFPLHSTTKGASLEMSAVSMQEGKITHMIPTPGSSNQQSLPGNFHYSTGTGYLNGKSNVMAQMQEQQAPFASKINCCPVQRDLGGYAGSGVHSDILNNSSPYGVSEAHMIDAPADIAASTSFNGTGSSALSTTSYLDMTTVNSLPKSRMDSGLIMSQPTIQSFQTEYYIQTEGLDLQEKISLEQLHQQVNQLHLIQPHSQYAQNQCSLKLQQQNSLHHLVMSRGNVLTQCHLGSDHAEKLLDKRNQLHSELVSSQINEHVGLTNLQGHYEQTQYHDNYKKGQMSASSQNLGIPAPHDLLPPQQQFDDGSYRLSCFLKETYTKPLQPHCKSKPMKEVIMTSLLSGKIQDGFCQKKMARDREHHPIISGWHSAGCAATSFGSEEVMENTKQYHAQARWLLFLFHAKSCTSPPGSCKSSYCDRVRELVVHLTDCQIKDCSYRHCRESKMVSDHYKNCINEHCHVCCKAKEMLRRSSELAHKQNPAEPILITQHNMNQRSADRVHGDRMDIDQAVETFDDQPPAAKRPKLQLVSPDASENVPVCQKNPGFMLQEAHPRQLDQNKKMVPDQEVDVGLDIRHPQVTLVSCHGSDEKIGAAQNTVIPGALNKIHCHVQQETVVADKESVTVVDVKKKTGSVDVTISKTGKPKVKGVSLMELFTPEQIHEHINSLRQWIGQEIEFEFKASSGLKISGLMWKLLPCTMTSTANHSVCISDVPGVLLNLLFGFMF
ncbi:probable histone acetyltransferase HAC-like 2 [Oryza sativa Japonica Group]|uniref:probable histone acetyltransferase HAC-like 2 n=1 Tax=Oryza sativa subsp. japonica TaxID=39947 RepID=UPI0007754B9F|nr:probable histone acetyltransferase HAC-like 2 [Oryza sativa Japonica Group]